MGKPGRSGCQRYWYPREIGDSAVHHIPDRETYDRLRNAAYHYAESNGWRFRIQQTLLGIARIERVA